MLLSEKFRILQSQSKDFSAPEVDCVVTRSLRACASSHFLIPKRIAMKHLLAIAIALTSAPFATAAENPSSTSTATLSAQHQNDAKTSWWWFPPRRIEGVWVEQIKITNCSTGATMAEFQATDMFIAGGALTDTSTQPPASRGPGFGTWWYAHGRNFGAAMRLNRYAPDGSFQGVNQVTRALSINADADELNGTISVRILNATGDLMMMACGTEQGTRAY
ncbi:MAG: hypothetical protein WAV67_10605 [Dokdonella sp.]